MTLALPDVTLVAIDTGVAAELLLLSLIDTVEKIIPFETHVWGSKILHNRDFIYHPLSGGFQEVFETLWYEVPKHIKTSHFLVVQWDSWVTTPEAWKDDFLDFDYIGAPWWHNDDFNVGNGGFSLRSRRLAEHVAQNRMPLFHPEDTTLCRIYGRQLRLAGYRWPSTDKALSFAFERVVSPKPSFGFHGIFNWSRVLSRHEFVMRMGLAIKNEYVSSRPEWPEAMRDIITPKVV